MKLLDWYFETCAYVEASLRYAKEYVQAPPRGQTFLTRFCWRYQHLRLAWWVWRNGAGGLAVASAWVTRERIFKFRWERRLNRFFSLTRLPWQAELTDKLRVLRRQTVQQKPDLSV